MELDNVFNSAATGGEGGTAGVLAINGYDGYINLKSINGQSLIGSGDIEISGGSSGDGQGLVDIFANDGKLIGMEENGNWRNEVSFKTINGQTIIGEEGDIKIEGGSTAGVEAINIGEEIQDWTQKTGIVPVYTSFYDGSYDVAIGGTSFYGLKPVDNSIVLENAGGTVNGNFRCGIKVNEDNFKTINGESIFGTGDITIEGGGSEPEQYIVSIEDFWMYTKEEPYKKLCLQYIDSSNKNEIITKEIILEWTGTQSEYDALGEYDDSITYNIIEG